MKTHAPRPDDSDFQRKLRSAIRAAGGQLDDLLRAIPALNKATVQAWLRHANPNLPKPITEKAVRDLLTAFWSKKRTQQKIAAQELGEIKP